MKKQPKINQLLDSYLELMFQVGVKNSKVTLEKVYAIAENFVRLKAAKEGITQTEILDKISTATLTIRRLISDSFIEIESKFTLDDIDRNELQQYRYKITNISKIHEHYTGKKLSRQSVNEHKKNKLKTVKLPDEYTSVLEKDLINYIMAQAGVKVEPNEELRQFAYKKPLALEGV